MMTLHRMLFGSQNIAAISLFINAIISLVTFVNGNGYLKEPISRNYFAYKYGVGDGSTDVEGLPPKEICHYCLNTNAGVCGIASYTTDYDDPRDTLGQPLPWDSMATYTEGDIISIKFDITTFRYGHVTMSACPLVGGQNNATMACMAQHPLVFVDDVLYEMPPDANYPDRAYLMADKEEFEMRFRLPDGLVGEEVLLQWRYITADVTCHAVGYDFYNWPEGSYYHDELDDCDEELNDDGMIDEMSPEQFFNCAEVTIVPKKVTTEVVLSSSWSSDDGGGSEYCCTKDNITCVTYCGDSKEDCQLCSDDVFWMPTVVGSSSNSDSDDSNSSRVTDFTPIVAGPMITTDYRSYTPQPPSRNGNRVGLEYCCTQDNITCITYCGDSEDDCHLCSDDVYWMPIEEITNNSSSDDSNNSNVTEFTPTVTITVDNSAPPLTTTPNNTPTTSPPSSATLSCSQGHGFSSWEALIEIDQITHEVSTNPFELSVVTNDDIVFSEMQAYAMLLSSLALVSLTHNDNASENAFQFAMRRFEGYFNGWRRMCRYSRMNNCQNVTYCDNGRFLGATPCLPAWKHSIDLTHVLGHESAVNADEDAIVAMIIALKAVESRDTKPLWYEEVRDWADRSCTQFLLHDTVVSPRHTTGSSSTTARRRLLKLGECWGGWDEEGNTPSYHAPGHYRLMRDFQMSMTDVRTYELPTDITTSSSLSEVWNSLIDTSYEFLRSVQCPETGLVTNWALVTEEQQQHKNKTMTTLVAHHTSGAFVSGSGSDPNEFGREASKTMWRIAFDAVLYPDEAQRTAAATSFLSPLHNRLVSHFEYTVVDDDESLGDFGDESLQPCASSFDNGYGDGNNDKQRLVTSVPSAWMWISHIASPVLSTLVTPINPQLFSDKAFDQQFMVDTACDYAQDLDNLGDDHYSFSWQLLAMVILNGDVTKAGRLLAANTTNTTGETHPSHAPSSFIPLFNNKTNNQHYCCSIDDIPCSEFSDAVCHESRYDCVNMCGGQWVVSSVAEDDVSLLLSLSSSSSSDDMAAPSKAPSSRIQ